MPAHHQKGDTMIQVDDTFNFTPFRPIPATYIPNDGDRFVVAGTSDAWGVVDTSNNIIIDVFPRVDDPDGTAAIAKCRTINAATSERAAAMAAYARQAEAEAVERDEWVIVVDGDLALLTTNSAASSHGAPVVMIDGVPHGPAEVGPIDIDGYVPDAIRDAAVMAGYEVAP